MDVFSVVFLCLWMLKPSLGENCSEHTCKLILDRKDLPVEFLSLSSEDGVRMVYLHLKGVTTNCSLMTSSFPAGGPGPEILVSQCCLSHTNTRFYLSVC